MELKILDYDLTVCKVASVEDIDLKKDFFFVGKTDEEISLVCLTEDTPTILADNQIGIFAVSTYNTDYILVKNENFDKAIAALNNNGYNIV